MTPAKAIERLGVEVARPTVEDGRETLEDIARRLGFGDPERMCQSFVRITGQTVRIVTENGRLWIWSERCWQNLRNERVASLNAVRPSRSKQAQNKK